MSEDRGGRLTNGACERVGVYVCVRMSKGGQSCNQITDAPSSPPSSTTSGAASIHTDMPRYTLASVSAQMPGTAAMCVCECVCVRGE